MIGLGLIALSCTVLLYALRQRGDQSDALNVRHARVDLSAYWSKSADLVVEYLPAHAPEMPWTIVLKAGTEQHALIWNEVIMGRWKVLTPLATVEEIEQLRARETEEGSELGWLPVDAPTRAWAIIRQKQIVSNIRLQVTSRACIGVLSMPDGTIVSLSGPCAYERIQGLYAEVESRSRP